MAILGRNNFVFTNNSAMIRALHNSSNAGTIASLNSASQDDLVSNIKKANNSFDSFQYLSENTEGSKMSIALKYMMEKLNV